MLSNRDWSIHLVETEPISTLTASNRSNNQKRLGSIRDRVGERRIRRFMRQIISAGKESYKWPPDLSNMITHCSAQHRISSLERVEHRALSDRSDNVKFHFAINVRERSQMRRENNTNHFANSKFEIRSSKQIRNPKAESVSRSVLILRAVLITWICFGFRASTFVLF